MVDLEYHQDHRFATALCQPLPPMSASPLPPSRPRPQAQPPGHRLGGIRGATEHLVSIVALDGHPFRSGPAIGILVDGLDWGPRVDLPAGELGGEVDFTDHTGQDDLGLHHGEFLADAVAGTLFEGPPGVLAGGCEELRVRERRLRGQEALRDELDGFREVRLVAVDDVRQRPQVEVAHRVRLPGLGVRDEEVLDPVVRQDRPERRRRWKHA